jgi:ATP-grasp domain
MPPIGTASHQRGHVNSQALGFGAVRANALQGLAPTKVLLLFGKDWDSGLLQRFEAHGTHRFFEHGFDLFDSFSNWQLGTFGLKRFVQRMSARYSGAVDAVFSSNEQFGALAASLVAQRLGLPGSKPATLLRAQHKYEARMHLQTFAPELCPRFEVIGYDITPAQAAKLPYPMFVKPVKATFSVLARRCDNPQELLNHLNFAPLEKFIIKRLIKPHNDALTDFPQFSVPTDRMIVEELLQGWQINVDGYVHQGAVHTLGLVDEVMYPGTMAFQRFMLPGVVQGNAALRARVQAATEKVVRGFELDHGFFNVEFFYNPDTDDLKLIEINPRLAAQLGPLYEWTQGIDIYTTAFALAQGLPPPPTKAPRFGAAASLVWRSFDGTSCPRIPTREDQAWLAREYPEAKLYLYPKKGYSLQRDIKWLGSHRWAIINMPGMDEADLKQRYERICQRFGWPAPYDRLQ